MTVVKLDALFLWIVPRGGGCNDGWRRRVLHNVDGPSPSHKMNTKQNRLYAALMVSIWIERLSLAYWLVLLVCLNKQRRLHLLFGRLVSCTKIFG